MQSIFEVTFPFFALVLCGYLAARTKALPVSAVPGLNAFVLFFALPCMLFRFGLNTPVRELVNPALLAVYLLAGLVIVFFTITTTRSRRVSVRDAAFGALVAAFPNSGFMGFPLLVALLGPVAAGPVITTLLVDLVLISSLCIAIARLHDSRTKNVWQSAWLSITGAFSNPLPWAIAAGVLAAEMRVGLPGPISQIIKMLADAASPVALFTIGAVLWRSSRLAEDRTPTAQVVSIALVKLLVHPMLVLLLGAVAYQKGAPITAFQLKVLTLTAALPSASNVALLAERYYADTGRVARIIMASTLMAFVTFSMLAWAFSVNGK